MRELVMWLAQQLVDRKDAVEVDTIERDRDLVFELSVDPDDMGRVIGRNGRTAKAMRTVLEATARKEGRRVFLDIIDD